MFQDPIRGQLIGRKQDGGTALTWTASGGPRAPTAAGGREPQSPKGPKPCSRRAQTARAFPGWEEPRGRHWRRRVTEDGGFCCQGRGRPRGWCWDVLHATRGLRFLCRQARSQAGLEGRSVQRVTAPRRTGERVGTTGVGGVWCGCGEDGVRNGWWVCISAPWLGRDERSGAAMGGSGR